MSTELARIKHLLLLASDYERQAECTSESRKREEMRKLAWTYREMALEIEKPTRAMEIAAATAGVHRVDNRLYLQITGGGREWVHRYQFKGRARWSGLGSAHRMSLAEARAARDHERRLIEQGIDPIAARKEAKAA